MKKIETIKKLEKYPIFTLNDFVKMIGKSPEYCWLCLSRLKQEGLIFQVERGKYTAFNDPMIFASHITAPSYISFWTAFRLYNFTDQLPLDIMVASSRSKRSIEFGGTRIRFFRMKELWGYQKQRYLDFDIFLAEPEKAIIDSLLLKNIPFDEIAKAVLSKEFDAKKLVNYAIKTGNNSLIKRLGYLMDLAKLDSKKLAGRPDNNYVPLDWAMKKKGGRISKWRIIANREDDIN